MKKLSTNSKAVSAPCPSCSQKIQELRESDKSTKVEEPIIEQVSEKSHDHDSGRAQAL